MTKKTTHQTAKALVVGLAAVLGAGQAHAQTYTIEGSYATPTAANESSTTIQLEAGWNMTIDGTAEGPGALVGDIQLVPTTHGTTINTVCTDIAGTVWLGENYTYVQKTFAAAPSGGIDPIWGWDNATATSSNYDTTTANEAIQNAAYLFATYGSVLTTGTLSQKAALQLAIWTVLYDTGAPGNQGGYLTVGNNTDRFFVTTVADANAVSIANSWLHGLGLNGINNNPQYSGSILTPAPLSQNGEIAQEMLLTPVPVPEPTTVLAGAVLLLPFGLSTFRFVRKNCVV